MDIDGVFVFIGYIPQTKFLQDCVKLNHWGEIIIDSTYQTNHKGVFAAGEEFKKIPSDNHCCG